MISSFSPNQTCGRRYRHASPVIYNLFTILLTLKVFFTFVASKMRMMHDLMSKCIERDVESIKNSKNGTQFESKQLFRRFCVDVIATCVYGVEVDSFGYPENEFYKVSQKVNLFQSIASNIKVIGHHLVKAELMKKLKVKLVDDETLNYFHDLMVDTMKMREETGTSRNDMIQLLMQAKRKRMTYDDNHVDELKTCNVNLKEVWDDDDLIAQSYIFFLAGMSHFKSKKI